MMRLKLLPPRAIAAIAALAVLACALNAGAQAQTRATPLPPPRPSNLGAPPASTAPAPRAPASGKPAPDSAKADETFDLDHPPMLPSASRERMSACGREWQAVKKAGKDVDIGWREFATRCLTR